MRPVTVSLRLTTADADGICESQTTSGAVDLEIDGQLGYDDRVAYLGAAAAVRITSAGDDTGITFTVYGTDSFGGSIFETIAGASGGTSDTNQKFVTVSRVITSGTTAGDVEAGTAVVDDSISEANTITGASGLAIDGVAIQNAKMYGVATLVPAQVVKIVSAGNDSGVTFTVYGRDAQGTPISEAITGASGGTATGTTLFTEVIAVSASGRPADVMTVGIAGDLDNICESKRPAASGHIVFNGVGCELFARHVSIYSGGDESDITFTVKGLDRAGLPLTEEITGPDTATVKGVKNFSVVHTVRSSAAVGNAVTVGSADEAELALLGIDRYTTKTTYQIARSSDADFDSRLGITAEDVQAGDKDEYTARYLYPSGWQVVDEFNALDGSASALRLSVRSHVLGTVDLTVLSPAI